MCPAMTNCGTCGGIIQAGNPILWSGEPAVTVCLDCLLERNGIRGRNGMREWTRARRSDAGGTHKRRKPA